MTDRDIGHRRGNQNCLTMARNLAILLLPALFSQAFCLQCNSCEGEYDCVGQQVTCESPTAACSTSVRKAAVSFLEFQTVKKGCVQQLYPYESISLNSHLMAVSHQARYCAEDNCNNESYFVSHPRPANQMRCHSCASQGSWCPEAARTQISCVGDQDQCLDLDITGNLGQFSNMKLKGCANLPRCQETLSFFSGTRTIHASCCDDPLCNSFTRDLNLQSQAPNGLECYSCVDDDGSAAGCSNQSISKIQCTGVHNMCLEGIGKSRKGGQDMGLITFKGCASPAMCQSSLLALVQELEDTNVLCCQGNLCNKRIIDGVVLEPKIPADSADLGEARECITPTRSGPTPNPDCDYEYEDDTIVVEPGHGSHTDKEMVNTIDEKENAATDGSSATTDLEKSESGTGTTSSGNHGNVVVLVPIVVPKKNTTAAPASSSTETTIREDVAASDNDKSEVEECEADDEDDGAGEHFAAANEDNMVSSHGFTPRPGPSATATHGATHGVAASGENFIAGSSTPQPGRDDSGSATEHGANTHVPLPYILSRDNESFVVAGEMETGTPAVTNTNTLLATSSPNGEVLVSGAGVGSTPRPKNKIPCKRPKATKKPETHGASNHIAERSLTQDLQLSDTKNPGKVNYHSGAFGLAGNLGLLSLSILLAALFH